MNNYSICDYSCSEKNFNRQNSRQHGPAVSMDEVIRKGKELYETRQKAREEREREREARGATESDEEPKVGTKGRRRRCKKLP